MIYIVFGDDIKSKNLYIKKIINKNELIIIPRNENKDIILNYSSDASLFGKTYNIILENQLNDDNNFFDKKEIDILAKSKNLFIFNEDKLSISDKKKFEKYGEVHNFSLKKQKIKEFNIFSITDSFEEKNKINTWLLYNKAIETGISGEAISGILFWKIKSMIISESKKYSKEELIHFSSQIVDLYHQAHKGETDLIIGLEQFILDSLSNK